MMNYSQITPSLDGDVSIVDQLCFPFLTSAVLSIVTRALICVNRLYACRDSEQCNHVHASGSLDFAYM